MLSMLGPLECELTVPFWTMSMVRPIFSSTSEFAVFVVWSDDAERPCAIEYICPRRSCGDVSSAYECVDSSMGTRRGGGFGSRISIGRGCRLPESLATRSSSGVFARRAHQLFERLTGSAGVGFASMIDDGRGRGDWRGAARSWECELREGALAALAGVWELEACDASESVGLEDSVGTDARSGTGDRRVRSAVAAGPRMDAMDAYGRGGGSVRAGTLCASSLSSSASR